MIKNFIRNLIPDIILINYHYKKYMGKKLNLKSPETYNEKLQWLKLYDRNPFYATLVDKYEVRKYVTSQIGEKYVIPVLGVWDNVEDIEWNSLPDNFVLKCTHDSGGIIICNDKKNMNIEVMKTKLSIHLTKNFYYQSREWPYKYIKPRIIAEPYLEDKTYGELRDYKFFVFNGNAKYMFIATDRNKDSEETKFDFYDMEFSHLDIRNGHPNATIPPNKPVNYELMKELAEKLAGNIPHVRVDFYEVNGNVYFGELTFYHWGGYVPFEPEIWDEKFGDMLELPRKKHYIL